MSPREWLARFLDSRKLTDGPDERRLFGYQTVRDEYEGLTECLRSASAGGTVPIGDRHWQAAFCLLVSEFYRRDYPGPAGWSWSDAEARIGADLTPQLRAAAVRHGLHYWRRPAPREGEHGYSYLGTLFAEGGLPWKLVGNDSHGFGRTIGAGLAYQRRVGTFGLSLPAYLDRYGRYLPKTFDNAETVNLLAGIVLELTNLATRYPELSDQKDPVGYLDRTQPNWKAGFPIPLGERNGRELVGSWLIRAAHEREYSERRRDESAGPIECVTWTDEPRLDTLRSSITVPTVIDFETDVDALTVARFIPIVYEGNRSVRPLTPCYGRIGRDEDGNPTGAVRLRTETGALEIVRSSIDEPLSLRIFAEGRRVATLPIEQYEADAAVLPLIFVRSDDRWHLVGCTSVGVADKTVRIYLPDGAELADEPAHDSVGAERRGGTWLDLRESATVHTSAGPVRIDLGDPMDRYRPEIVGQQDNRETDPVRCFLGFPQIRMPESSTTLLDGAVTKVDGRRFARGAGGAFVGAASLTVATEKHGLLLRRRFGVLPRDLRMSLVPASSSQPVRLAVRTESTLRVEVADVDAERITGAGHQFGLSRPDPTDAGDFRVLISSGEQVDPVVVRMPWPGEPARLVEADGRAAERSHFGIDKLLGLRLVLSRPDTSRTEFHISFTLEGHRGRKLDLHHRFEVDQAPLELPLDAYRDDFLSMFSARSDQDARIAVRVETSQQHLLFYVSRFDARLAFDGGSDAYQLKDMGGQILSDAGTLCMTDLTRPETSTVSVPERLTESVPTGLYDLPEVSGTGPWIIYAPSDCDVAIRPCFVPGTGNVETSDYPTELHRACALFQPVHRPTVIDDVVARMSEDFDHPGWELLRAIKLDHAGLPLSSFETWRSVARSPEALVAAFVKLEITVELAARMASELAVIWETIPLELWFRRIGDYERYIGERLDSPELTGDVVRSLLQRLALSVPIHEEYVDLTRRQVKPPSGGTAHYDILLHGRFMELRQRQAMARSWPCQLEAKLVGWQGRQQALPFIEPLYADHPSHVRAVVLSPLFLACVAAGRHSLDELDDDLDAVRFDLRVLADFDPDWFELAYRLATNYLYQPPEAV